MYIEHGVAVRFEHLWTQALIENKVIFADAFVRLKPIQLIEFVFNFPQCSLIMDMEISVIVKLLAKPNRNVPMTTIRQALTRPL